METFLARKLKHYRLKHDLTQKQLASILYVSDKTVSKWERGNGQPDIETLKKIAQLLETTIDDLLNEREPVTYFEYKSPLVIALLPILHIVIPNIPELLRTYGLRQSYYAILRQMPKAKGVISCGFFSTGILSVGIFSRGLFSIGVLSLGAISVGGITAGLVSLGHLSLGLLSFGNLALGLVIFANLGIGYLGIGNLIAAKIAVANQAAGEFAFSLGSEVTEKEILEALHRLQQLDIPALANRLLVQPVTTALESPWPILLLVSVVLLLSAITIIGIIIGLLKLLENQRRAKSFSY
ncbi:helix-turn-helix transcriptional regulator [Enterococcus sp. 669A]|uniref:Helix-turn-helix transcriptional regulator n=1 Tax=Candidatus Enterococcus moelleringii TaxID=2815325 RepID=A0ABS3L9J7_9ENTE|nr:helix-turn-helix transcriptional regulator [Enterococcus sp. 669A]MBO1306313.1 helix-turn-helix transcriptional regulator [Enterococcus sp. 669A]